MIKSAHDIQCYDSHDLKPVRVKTGTEGLLVREAPEFVNPGIILVRLDNQSVYTSREHWFTTLKPRKIVKIFPTDPIMLPRWVMADTVGLITSEQPLTLRIEGREYNVENREDWK